MSEAVDEGALPSLHASGRAAQLAAMAARPLDVLVVGGGITGVGVALDAVTRGLRVGVVEREDWASGTSSRSSKMIHGGLRYLATGDIGVVRESLRERAAIQRNAAHLVRALPMLLPVYGGGPVPVQRMKLAAALTTYDVLGHRRAAGRRHEWVGLRELTRMVPGVAIDAPAGGGALRGAQLYHDAAADDCRLVLAVLRTAVRHGALVANGAPVARLLRDGETVRGALVEQGAAGPPLEIEARVVVNATGVWADQLLGGEEQAGFRLLPSKGIHLTVRRDRVGVERGIAFFEQTDNSNVFVEPWQEDLAFVGTTDTPYAGDLAAPEASDDDVEWLLAKVNQFLRDPLEPSDVIARWAGLRPLVAPSKQVERSKDVSRRHLIVEHPGVVTITGGKLTAYRAMAEAAVDAAVSQLGVSEPSRTAALPLDGCRPAPSASDLTSLAARLRADRTTARHLLRRHGSNAAAIAELVQRRPELGERLHPERPYLVAEAAWAITHEQARSASDIVHRRTRLGLEVRDVSAAREVADALVQEELQGSRGTR